MILLLLGGCGQQPQRVNADDHDAFWLWAGVKPQPVLERAKTIYILEGEVRKNGSARIERLRAGTPRIGHADVWLVYRVETINWDPDIVRQIKTDLVRWRKSGSRAVGIQIDFDAATRGLDGYASFLKTLRSQLPPGTKLGITGLMDWSSRADPGGLKSIAPIVDEIIIQTYQGQTTIEGYESYLVALGRLDIPYRLGVAQGGLWLEPQHVKRDPNFEGYVVFLLNPETS